MQKRDIQTLTIEEGPLGPVQPCTLEFAPFTVLIGKQGTGKSLVAQVLYLFNHLAYLVPYYTAKRKQPHEAAAPPGIILSECVNNLRSANGAFRHFVDQQLKLTWRRTTAEGDEPFSIRLFRARGKYPAANEPLQQYMEDLHAAKHQALFVPTERLLYSQGGGPSIWQLLSLPITLQFFTDAMERAARTVDGWDGGEPDTSEGHWLAEQAMQALSGCAVRTGDAWRWFVPATKRWLAIDMASSGQRANWPLTLLAQVLFSWRQSGDIAEPFSIYVEEPEIHLHPEAQVAMVRILDRTEIPWEGKRPDGVLVADLGRTALVCFIELKATMKGDPEVFDRAADQLRGGVAHFCPLGPGAHGQVHHGKWRSGEDRLPLLPDKDHVVMGVVVAFRQAPPRPLPIEEHSAGKQITLLLTSIPMAGYNRAEISLEAFCGKLGLSLP